MHSRVLAPRCPQLLLGRGCKQILPIVPFALPAPSVHQLHQVDTDSAQARTRTEPLPKATVTLANNNPKHTETELVLDMAQQDLAELCKEEGSTECWKALDYFVAKRHQYEQHCDLEHELGEQDASACTALNGFEKFTREQMTAGSVSNLRNNLRIMQRAEDRRVARGEAGAVPQAMSDEEIHARVCRIRLFHAMDTDGDGEIGMLEFQDGMEALGAVITETDIQQISDALGNSNNRMDIDDFMEVLDASSVLKGMAIGDDSNFLRHSSHVHGSQHLGGTQGTHLSGHA